MTICNPITVDEDDSDPLQDSEDSPITVDPCLFIVLYPEEFTEVDADGHSAPITVGVFVITDEVDEEGENILVPVEAASLKLEATGAESHLDESTLETDEDGLAQTQLTTDTEVGQEYTVSCKLSSYTYNGQERSFAPDEEPTLTTAVMQVVPGSPAQGFVQVGRVDAPCDERSEVEVSISGVQDRYGNPIDSAPLSARLFGASGAVVSENTGNVLAGEARLILRSGSFPETLILQTICGTLDRAWVEETEVPFVDFTATASQVPSVPANSTITRAIQISVPDVADGTPMRLYSTRGTLQNNDTTIFNGAATIIAQASGLPAGTSTLFGTVASRRVFMYGVYFEPDPELDIEVTEKILAGDRTTDGTVFIEQLDGPDEEPPQLSARPFMASASPSPGSDGYVVVKAATYATIHGIAGHEYEVELRQVEQYPVLDFRVPPNFFQPFTPSGLPPQVVATGYRFIMPAENFVTITFGSLGTWPRPNPRSQLLFSTILVRDLTLAKSRTHQLTVGEAKLVASVKNFADGFFLGEGDGAYGLVGDLVANTIPFVGNIRDLIIELYHAVSGDEVHYAAIGFSLAGIIFDFVPGIGEASGLSLGLIKRALKQFKTAEMRMAVMVVGKRVFRLIKEAKTNADLIKEIQAVSNVLQALLSADRTQVETWGESLGSSGEKILQKAADISRVNPFFLDVLVASLSRSDASRRLVETLSLTPAMLAEAVNLTKNDLEHLVDVLELVSDCAPAYLNTILIQGQVLGPNYRFSKLIDTAWIVKGVEGLDAQFAKIAHPIDFSADGARYELDVAAYFVTNVKPIGSMRRLFPYKDGQSDLDLSNGIVVNVKKGAHSVNELENWYTTAELHTHVPWSDIYFVSTLDIDQLEGKKKLLKLLRKLGVVYIYVPFIPAE